jgi:hypothetical protein
MSDKSWMLNPQAIRYAKECIFIVKNTLEIKLKLSHPNFIEMLVEYAELTDSNELQSSLGSLMEMAGPNYGENIYPLPVRSEETATVTKIKKDVKATQLINSLSNTATQSELVDYQGRQYNRYRDGKSFHGLYRGQPVYR